MAWFINEVSFTGQYETCSAFIEHLKVLLKLRQSNSRINSSLYCSRHLPNLKVSGDYTFRDAVNAEGNKDLTRQVLGWLDKKGPFIDAIREQIDNDDFELFDTVVTDYAVGEAARQKLHGNYAALYSLETPVFDMSLTPLVINQIDEKLQVLTHEIDNYWLLDELVKSVEEQRVAPRTWREMLDLITESCSSLCLSEELEEQLIPHPFSHVICKHILFCMHILNRVVDSRDTNGEYTEETHQLLEQYFLGDGAMITDESAQNKASHKKNMTFKDPRDTEKEIFCSWHAKISYRYFRVHFEFPLESTKKQMAICYMGPKITKR